jgi:hypothetical protein
MDEDHPMLKMPDIETDYAAGYLVGLLQEAGLMSSNGMGPVPLSWVDIDAWLRVTEADVSLWEKTTIKRLSEEYVGELVQASDKLRPAPYLRVEEEVDRDAVQQKILNVANLFKKRVAPEDQSS